MKKHWILVLFSIFFFVSCDQGVKNIDFMQSALIFEFDDSISKPKQRMSVFAEISYDSRKVQQMELMRLESDEKWIAEDLIQLVINEKMTAGFPNFVPSPDSLIENGTYQVSVVQYDGSSLTKYFNLDYDKALASMKSEEFTQWIKNNGGKKQLIIFDQENTVLYFGDQTESLTTQRDIWLKYNNAAYYNEVWILNSKLIMGIMPAKEIKPGDNNG